MTLLSVVSAANFQYKIPYFADCERGNNVSVKTGILSFRKATHISRSVQTNGSVTSVVTDTPTITPAIPVVKDNGPVTILVKDNGPVTIVVQETPTISTVTTPTKVPVTPVISDPDTIKRSDFPPDFLFGVGSSAIQTEGAFDKDGKGLNMWDVYAHENNIPNADVATDSYYRYKEDIQLLKDMGVTTYRFSISWPRILPKGNLEGGINQAGIDHYKEVIKELTDNGIEPFVTLFHFDTPQALQDKYGGFLSRRIVNDFRDYCEICFDNFGDSVKYWTLINEPSGIAQYGYDTGISAPGRASLWYNKQMGNSAREPYTVSHHLILAHAAASKLYKDNYQAHQGGKIGISLVANWFLPHSDLLEDQSGVERACDFNLGWYLGPLFNGEYPDSMKYLVRDRLPVFTDEEKEMIKGSVDFIGVNYYTSSYTRSLPITNDPHVSAGKDCFVEQLIVDSDGIPLGEKADGGAQFVIYPEGLTGVLVYLKEKYNNPTLIVTENGTTRSVKNSTTYAIGYHDGFRVQFMKEHISAVKQAIEKGANVKGYFYWSLLDSFEFAFGYTVRFGLNFTDFDTLDRNNKLSAEWYKSFLKQ